MRLSRRRGLKMYVDLLVKGTKKNRCKPEDVGIIAPYHKQVQTIRMILGAHGYNDCKVGSVEEFQGSERPVIIISTVRSTVDFIQFDKNYKVSLLFSFRSLIMFSAQHILTNVNRL